MQRFKLLHVEDTNWDVTQPRQLHIKAQI